MNKKLLALAIAAALAPAAAMADSGNVTIYGSIHMSVDSLNGNSKTTAPVTDNGREMNISNNSSYIGFKGNEDLGNGLKAIWQLENQVDMGGTGGTAANNAWTNRNSYLGLTGGFGTTILGIHDTPVKLLGRKVDLFGDQIGDSRNLISAAGNNAMWDLRPGNVIAYISPTMSGFHGAVAYVSNLQVSAINATTGAATTTSTGFTQENSVTALSALGMYESGPVMVGLGYEKHNLSNLNNGTTVTDVQDEKIWRLVGGYSFGDFKVTGLYQKVSDAFDIVDSGTSPVTDRKTWGLGGAYKMGATTLKAQYYKANDKTNCGSGVDCSATGASLIAVGADYSLSKRTTAYVAYAKTNNDSSSTAGVTQAAFSAFGGGHGDNPGTIAGKDPSGFSLGMKHAF